MSSQEFKNIKELATKEYSFVRVLIDNDDYRPEFDTRLLIPFSYYQHYGLMNQNGDVVVEPKYDRILDSCRNEFDVVRVGVYYTYGFNRKAEPATYLRTKWGLVDSKGKFILEPEFKGIGVSDDKKILTIHYMDGQYGVANIDGEEIVPKGKYQWIDSFEQGLARVNYFDGENKKWGIIDDSGKEVLPLKFSEIWNFYNRNRKTTTIESIDEYGNKHIGHFNLITHEVTI